LALVTKSWSLTPAALTRSPRVPTAVWVNVPSISWEAPTAVLGSVIVIKPALVKVLPDPSNAMVPSSVPLLTTVLLSDAKQPQVPMLTPLGPTITVPLLVMMLLSPAAMPRPPAPS
jgi:hypothetical protein